MGCAQAKNIYREDERRFAFFRNSAMKRFYETQNIRIREILNRLSKSMGRLLEEKKIFTYEYRVTSFEEKITEYFETIVVPKKINGRLRISSAESEATDEAMFEINVEDTEVFIPDEMIVLEKVSEILEKNSGQLSTSTVYGYHQL